MIHDLTSNSLSSMTGTGIDYSGQQVTLSNSDLSSSPTPSPDPRLNGKPGRPVNPLPRHKRDSHINAEHRRRNKIKKGFETLKTLVPALQDSTSLKESKASMLFKAVEHCRQIQAECKAQQEEACALRQELGSVNEDIEKLQAQLPDSGVDRVHRPRANLEDMFDEYITERTKENWKFLFFSYLIRPLFESYNKMVNTETMQNFRDAVHHWREAMLSLSSLRQGSLAAMLQISTQTCIMDEPHKISAEANEGIVQLSPSLKKEDTPSLKKEDTPSLKKEETPMSTAPVAEKNIASALSSFSSLKSSAPSTPSSYTPCWPSTSVSFSSSSSSYTSFSSSSSFSNPSNQASSSTNFLAPVPVDNLMVGASAASTVSNIDLSFLDRYSANYNSTIMERPSADYLSTPNQNVNLGETNTLFWDDMQEFMLLSDTLKDKHGGASPIATPPFDLSSFDLTQFTNNYETFEDNQTDVSAANSGKFLRKV